MTITGKLIKNNRIVEIKTVTNDEEGLNMTKQLESCLLDLCKFFNVPVPIWMNKNTKEFVNFKKTFFTSEQFIEKVYFDEFSIELDH